MSNEPVDTVRTNQILKIAAEAFASSANATLAEIGTKLGMRKSIVHYYFDSKEALIRAVYGFYLDHYSEQSRSIGLELTILSMSRQDPKLAGAVRKAWKAERERLYATGMSMSQALFIQAAKAGLGLAIFVDPDMQSDASTLEVNKLIHQAITGKAA